MKRKTWIARAVAFPAAAWLLMLAGCVQVEMTVEMHDKDPGATIRERIRVSRELQQVCGSKQDRKELLSHLTQAAARRRMESMGKGITLVSHRQDDRADGSVECVVVYEIPRITDLRIVNPFLFDRPAASGARITYGLQKNRRGKPTNQTRIEVSMVDRKLKYPESMIRPAVTPLERQILRDVRPILCDMLQDFQATVKLEVPTRFLDDRSVRGTMARTKTATLFSISGRDLDRHGNGFFENEEILLAVLQMDVERISRYAEGFVRNSRLPVFRGAVWDGARFRILQTTHQKKEYSK